MIEEFTRPLNPEERAELTDLVENIPRPWRNAWRNGGLALISFGIAVAMGGVIWAIMIQGWSEMVVGSLAIIPSAIMLLALCFGLILIGGIPGNFGRERAERASALAARPRRQAVLDSDVLHVTRVRATGVIEISDYNDWSVLSLFSLPDGDTFYYESLMDEIGAWPNHSFEIVCGVVDDDVVWKRTYGTGAYLDPSLRIEDPGAYSGFEAFIERQSGDEPFTQGRYAENSEALLVRMLGVPEVIDGRG